MQHLFVDMHRLPANTQNNRLRYPIAPNSNRPQTCSQPSARKSGPADAREPSGRSEATASVPGHARPLASAARRARSDRRAARRRAQRLWQGPRDGRVTRLGQLERRRRSRTASSASRPRTRRASAAPRPPTTRRPWRRRCSPATPPATRPQTVVLVDQRDWPAALAASSLASAPLGAPILYADGDSLPDASGQALSAMHPIGAAALGGAQVLAIGTVRGAARRPARALGQRRRRTGGRRGGDSQAVPGRATAGARAR